MKRTLKSNYAGNQITGPPWQSKQHLEAIPKNLKQFAVFSVFLNKLAATIGNFVESQCNAGYMQPHSSDQRMVVGNFAQFLKSCFPSTVNKGNLRFLSHQILADAESVLGHVFGDVTADSIVAGHAGNLGYIMMKLSHPNQRKTQLQDVLEEIVETVMDPSLFTDQEIVAMGYQRRVDGEVTIQ
jgi:hypothetical protein